MRVHKHLDKAPDGGEALAWIYRIATNYCLNEIRDRKPAAPSRPMSCPSGSARPSSDVLADRDLVARIVRRSPEKLRVAAWLHHVDGLDQGEVARVLGARGGPSSIGSREFAEHARKFAARSAA